MPWPVAAVKACIWDCDILPKVDSGDGRTALCHVWTRTRETRGLLSDNHAELSKHSTSHRGDAKTDQWSVCFCLTTSELQILFCKLSVQCSLH